MLNHGLSRTNDTTPYTRVNPQAIALGRKQDIREVSLYDLDFAYYGGSVQLSNSVIERAGRQAVRLGQMLMPTVELLDNGEYRVLSGADTILGVIRYGEREFHKLQVRVLTSDELNDSEVIYHRTKMVLADMIRCKANTLRIVEKMVELLRKVTMLNTEPLNVAIAHLKTFNRKNSTLNTYQKSAIVQVANDIGGFSIRSFIKNNVKLLELDAPVKAAIAEGTKSIRSVIRKAANPVNATFKSLANAAKGFGAQIPAKGVTGESDSVKRQVEKVKAEMEKLQRMIDEENATVAEGLQDIEFGGYTTPDEDPEDIKEDEALSADEEAIETPTPESKPQTSKSSDPVPARPTEGRTIGWDLYYG